MTEISGELIRADEGPDPLSVECPLCSAAIGRPCIVGGLRPRPAKGPHGARMKKARQMAKPGPG